jgi:hypothetical protein
MEKGNSFTYALGVMPTAHLPEASLSDNRSAIEKTVRDSGYDGVLTVNFHYDIRVDPSTWPSGFYTGWVIETGTRLRIEERDGLKKLHLRRIKF